MELLLFLLLTPHLSEAQKKPEVRQIVYHEKLSLKKLGEQILEGEKITELFRQNSPDKMDLLWQKKVSQLVKLNQKLMEKWLAANVSGEAFVRGEIDDEMVLNRIFQAVQLSILKIRLERQKNNYLGVKEELNSWFSFCATLPFDEASLVSLRLSNLVRSLLFDEIEAMQKQAQTFDELWLHWSKTVKIPWPIDRVILSESKRFVADRRLMKVTEKLAVSLQKNTYQTSAAALAEIGGGNNKDLEFLKKMWREEDIGAMKTEVNRLAAFRIRLAVGNYERKSGKKPTSIEELVNSRLLESVPINYLTGKPFDLTQAALH
jgi:hypothetical protein